MQSRCSIAAWTALLLFAGLPASRLLADPLPADQPTVSVTATHMLTRKPTELVMQIELVGRAPTLKQALGKLKDSTHRAEAALKILGALPDSITLGNPTDSGKAGTSQSRLEQMMRQRMLGMRGKRPQGLEVPETVTLSQPLTARWLLAGDDAAARLESAAALTKKITDADIAGVKSSDATLAEQELIEEAELLGQEYGEEEQAPAGTPSFFFMATISPEDRRQAMQSAFDRARQEAADLAAAAGMQLAGLARIENANNPSQDEMIMLMQYGYGGRSMGPTPDFEFDANTTSFTQDLSKAKFSFNVQATFYLQPQAATGAQD